MYLFSTFWRLSSWPHKPKITSVITNPSLDNFCYSISDEHQRRMFAETNFWKYIRRWNFGITCMHNRRIALKSFKVSFRVRDESVDTRIVCAMFRYIESKIVSAGGEVETRKYRPVIVCISLSRNISDSSERKELWLFQLMNIRGSPRLIKLRQPNRECTLRQLIILMVTIDSITRCPINRARNLDRTIQLKWITRCVMLIFSVSFFLYRYRNEHDIIVIYEKKENAYQNIYKMSSKFLRTFLLWKMKILKIINILSHSY